MIKNVFILEEPSSGIYDDCFESFGKCRKELKLRCSYPSYTCKYVFLNQEVNILITILP